MPDLGSVEQDGNELLQHSWLSWPIRPFLCANRSLPGLGSSGKGAGKLQILPKHALPRLLPLRLRKPKDADKTRLSLTTNSLLSTPCRVSFDTTTEVHLYSQSSDWPTEKDTENNLRQAEMYSDLGVTEEAGMGGWVLSAALTASGPPGLRRDLNYKCKCAWTWFLCEVVLKQQLPPTECLGEEATCDAGELWSLNRLSTPGPSHVGHLKQALPS